MTPRLNFQWDGYSWTTRVDLPEWRGYLAQSYLYRKQGNLEQSDGMVDLVFAPEGRGEGPLTEDELNLCRWFVDHHAAVSEAAIVAILDEYPTIREGWGFSEEELAVFCPPLHDRSDLRSLIGLHGVNIHDVRNGDEPYVGLELVCTWDEEHGLGLMMHGTRVVAFGGADTAILRWIATRHSEVN